MRIGHVEHHDAGVAPVKFLLLAEQPTYERLTRRTVSTGGEAGVAVA